MSIGKLEHCFEQASSLNTVSSTEEWNVFVTLVQKNSLLAPEDLEQLEKFRPTLPATFECIIATISALGSTPEVQEITEKVLSLDSKLLQFQGTLEIWDLRSLTKQELCTLLYKQYLSYTKILAAKSTLEAVSSQLSTYGEDVQRVVYDRIQDPSETATTAHLYQETEQVAIEKLWHKERTRSAQYRNRPVKVLSRAENGVTRQLGFCARKDTPVEVVKVPKALADYEFLTAFYSAVSAQKQLFFSKYFAHFLGFDDMTEEGHNLYFFDALKGLSLGKQWAGRTLAEKPFLLKHWAKELLCAFTDLLHMTTHSVKSPVTLVNVFVQDNGMKLYLKNIDFGEERDESTHNDTEIGFLHMYGNALYHLVTGAPEPSDLFSCPVHHYLKRIMEESAQMATKQSNSDKWYVQRNLTLKALQTHPFFSVSVEEERVGFDRILDEFDVLFPNAL